MGFTNGMKMGKNAKSSINYLNLVSEHAENIAVRHE